MKNIDYVNKVVANKLELKESDVKQVNLFYWRSLITEMHSFNNPAIFMRGVGNFYIPLKSVVKRLTKLIWQTKRELARQPDYKETEQYKTRIDKISNLWAIKQQLYARNERTRKKIAERKNKERLENGD